MQISGVNSKPSTGIAFKRWLGAFRLRARIMMFTALSILVVMAATAYLWPATYRSNATILIEQQEVPPELVRSTVTSYAAERIQVINQKVMTTTNLMRVIEKFDLYKDLRETRPREEILLEMRDSIGQDLISADVVDPRSGRPVEATIAFQVSFEHESPRIAQQVASELTSLYLNENVRQRTEMADQTRTFLANEAGKLNTRISQLEGQIAEFKSRHFDALPGQTDINVRLLDRTDQEIAELDRQLQSLRERGIYISSQLSSVSPQSPTFADTGERVLSPSARLKFLKSSYTSQAAVYAPEHPTVIRILKEIDALRAEYGEAETLQRMNKQLIEAETRLADARAKYTDEHPSLKQLDAVVVELRAGIEQAVSGAEIAIDDNNLEVEPDNPAYLRLQADLESIQAEQRALKNRRFRLSEDLQKYQQRLQAAPEVERQFGELLREYEQARLKHGEVRAKELEAEVSRSLEVEQKGERFTLIEPPLEPQQPVSPNRGAILALGALLAVGSAVGLGVLIENADQSVKGSAELFTLTGEPPLAVVPFIDTEADRSNSRSKRIKWLLASVVAGLLVLVLAHNFYRPLDVLIFVIMRKLGLN